LIFTITKLFCRFFKLDLLNCYSRIPAKIIDPDTGASTCALYLIYPLIYICEIYYSFLAGNRVVSSLFYSLGKCGNAYKLYSFIMDFEYQEKKGNLLAEIYSLRNLFIIYRFHKIFLSVNTNSGVFLFTVVSP
jgi:hypothetical protein